jgi:hypothetical protein
MSDWVLFLNTPRKFNSFAFYGTNKQIKQSGAKWKVLLLRGMPLKAS